MKRHLFFILAASFLFVSCGSKYKEESNEQQEMVTAPANDYQAPYTHSETTSAPNTSTEQQDESPNTASAQPQQPTLSRYYEEGYDKGYDDGEDDAVMENGYGGQYDDECPYKGQAEKDYQQGYEEGYEAGYYDNNEYDE